MADYNTKLYRVWLGMRDRCNNPNNKGYKNYGGRGIKICEEWNVFNNFKVWSYDHGYEENSGLSIDRIDVNGNYEPSNCRWATVKEQANNTRRNVYMTIDGETKSVPEWAEIYGVNQETVRRRVRELGWDPIKALTEPLYYGDVYEYNGESHLLSEWSKILGIEVGTLKTRIDRGWPIDKVFSTPTGKSVIRIEYDGETHTLHEWADIFGMNYITLSKRIREQGMSLEEAVKKPVQDRKKQFVVDNVSHTLPEWSKIYGVKLDTIYRRLQYGWSIKDAVTINRDTRYKEGARNG